MDVVIGTGEFWHRKGAKHMITTYEMAYVEVLALLRNYLSELEFNKIPKEKIDFFEKYKDRNYTFEINKELPIEKQDISEKANAILVILYRDYFADEQQKEALKRTLELNDKIKEKNKKNEVEQYNILFEKKKAKNIIERENQTDETSLVVIKKEKWYKKLFEFLNNIFIKKDK